MKKVLDSDIKGTKLKALIDNSAMLAKINAVLRGGGIPTHKGSRSAKIDKLVAEANRLG